MKHIITIINANKLAVEAITKNQEIKNLDSELNFEDQANCTSTNYAKGFTK